MPTTKILIVNSFFGGWLTDWHWREISYGSARHVHEVSYPRLGFVDSFPSGTRTLHLRHTHLVPRAFGYIQRSSSHETQRGRPG